MDTPGVNSKIEPVKHALLVRTALTFFPLNAIVIMIEFHDRVEKMIE